MLPKFPVEVAYLGGLLRKSRLVARDEAYEIHIEHESEFIDIVDALLKRNLAGKYKTEGSTLVVHSPDIFDILVSSFGHPDAERRWALTPDVKHGRPDHKAAFLRGLFDALGTFEDKTLVLKYPWHAADLKEVQTLLIEFEINSVVKKNELHVRDARTFASKIGSLRPANGRRFVGMMSG
ncbi:MAG: hypothetical protein HY366_02290 [Candidatus Aenigmarchaeota archaeon]|nr:hypothetical protein [Candidatus Aenigmarchaeota archaeon]